MSENKTNESKSEFPLTLKPCKEEMNLSEFPITLLSHKCMPDIKTTVYSDTIKVNGQKIEREWQLRTVNPNGLPVSQDNDLLIALMLIASQEEEIRRKIYFTRQQLCDILGISKNGKKFKRISEGLERLADLNIKAHSSFWDHNKKCYVDHIFGIIDNLFLYETQEDAKEALDESTFEKSYVILNEVVFKSIQAGYIKTLDTNFYFSLKYAISKRLYRFLDKWRYRNESIEFYISNAAYNHIGFLKKSYKYTSLIKQKLNPAHNELIERGFLKSANYKTAADGKTEKVVYIFNPAYGTQNPGRLKENTVEEWPALEETVTETEEPVSRKKKNKKSDDFKLSKRQRNIYEKLMDTGMTASIAYELILNYPLEDIEDRIESLKYVNADSKAGFLRSSIEGEWALPGEIKKEKEKRKLTKEAKTKKEKEVREKELRRMKIKSYLFDLSEESRTTLDKEAEERWKQDLGKMAENREIEPFMLNSYRFVIAAEKLGIEMDF